MIMSGETGGCGSVVSGMHMRFKLASSEARVLIRTPRFMVFLSPLRLIGAEARDPNFLSVHARCMQVKVAVSSELLPDRAHTR